MSTERAAPIANARMYAVSPEAAAAWRALLSAVFATAEIRVTVIDHPAPAPLEDLWRRTDQGAVFMCGLPFSRAEPQPLLIAAPVPNLEDFKGRAEYWSEFVVRTDSGFTAVEDTFGKRLALTVPHSQSGCVAALSFFLAAHRSAPTGAPLFGEIIAPTITPLGALTAVIDGAADLAPIDSYTLRLLQRYRPELTSRVRVLARTVPTPIPPLVASHAALRTPQARFTAKGMAADGCAGRLAAVFAGAHLHAPLKALMEPLMLQRFERPDPEAYDVLRDRFEAAIRYWGAHRLAAVTHPAFAL
jgi:ABC-type phosphate/phosphonate transport system substrate-binding protein